jgi:hypothetical protein
MKRYESWREEYRCRRYLQHFSSAQLNERTREIANNLLDLSPDGKIGPLTGRFAHSCMRLFSHVQEEYLLRKEAFSSRELFDLIVQQARWVAGRESKQSCDWRKILMPAPEGAVIKYGSAKFLKPLLEEGNILLRSASYYQRLFDVHRGDKERIREAHVYPQDWKVTLVSHKDGMPFPGQPEVKVTGNIKLTAEAEDYYMWCASTSLKRRLFTDFSETDCCVIITEPREYVRRLAEAFSEQALEPKGHFCAASIGYGPVNYYDPCDPPAELMDIIDVPWFKAFNYAYQQEWRIVAQATPLGPEELPLRLGSLSDIAELRLL